MSFYPCSVCHLSFLSKFRSSTCHFSTVRSSICHFSPVSCSSPGPNDITPAFLLLCFRAGQIHGWRLCVRMCSCVCFVCMCVCAWWCGERKRVVPRIQATPSWASLFPLSPSPSSPPSSPHTTSSHRGRTTRVPLLLTGAEPRDNQFFSQGSNDAITTSLGGVTGGDRSFRPRADLFIVRISTACLPIRYAKSYVLAAIANPSPSIKRRR